MENHVISDGPATRKRWPVTMLHAPLRQAFVRGTRSAILRLGELLSIPWARTVMIAAAVFVIDCLTPLGIAVGSLYMAAVLSAVPMRCRRAIHVTAGVCSLLVLVGWIVSPGQGQTEWWKVLFNRSIDLGVIWAAAGMADVWRRFQEDQFKQMLESRLLHQAAALSASQLSFRDALKNSLKALCDIVGWPAGHVYVRDGSGQYLVATDVWHVAESGGFELLQVATRGLRFSQDDGAAGRVWKAGKPIAVADVSESPGYAWLKEPERLGVVGAFLLPVTVGGKVVAVMEFFSEQPIRVDAKFTPLARSVGEQLGRLFERRKAEHALRQSEERLRLALQGSCVGMWEWHMDTGQVIWSPELEEIHGLAPGTFEGTLEAMQREVHPEDRGRVTAAIEQVLDEGGEYRVEYRIIRPDGSVRWLEGRGTVHTEPDGQSRRLVGVCMNITERKTVEREMQEAREKAETANLLQSRFLANMSHELRTPMNSILGMLQLALSDELTPEMRGWLNTAKSSADSLLVLLNELLDLSKIDAGKLAVESEPFCLREALDETIRSLAPRAFERGLELVCDVEHDVPDQLVGDVYRLRQVVTNLVANAVKFTDSGEVVVTVEREQEADTHVVQFSVTDTGTGISADDQHRIFEPFVQSDTLTARHQGGVGLGLSISRELVRRMGGELKLTSIPGQGSRFWFSLPLRAGWDTTLGEFAWEDVRQLQGKSVLIVDANAASREVLTRMLTRWAMIPDIGVDYDHALGKLFRAEAEGRSFTLMIIDAGTAGMDGTMLLARLAETLDKVPAVVLMTYPGRARDDEGDNTGDRPAVEYLEKPVSTSRLLPTIRRALGLECSMKDTESKSAVLQSASRALSVLLAEDTPANQEVIRNVLVRRGHRVTVVGDGAEAAAVVEREAFDVVLMDVTMPVMDGYEATRAIRDREGRGERRVPIIALTAHAMQGVREACTAAGMDAHLVKPIDVGKLIELVESAAQSRVLAKHLELQATGIDAESPAAQIDMGYPARLADIDVVHSSTEGNGETIIDYRGALVRLGGDEALFRDVVRLFDQDTPGLLQRIRTCIDEDDAEELQRAAHSLRGLVANFGAKGVAERARCLEQMAKSLRLEGAMNVADELEWKVAQLNQALSRFREPQNTAQ